MKAQTITGQNTHAIVIGGSFAGLLTARVLSAHFAKVTILERDAVHSAPEARRGQPQTRHAHVLLAAGQMLLEQLFPGFTDEAAKGGAIFEDIGDRTVWYAHGGYRVQIKTGKPSLLASRPYLEWLIRRRVLQLPNVTLLDETAVEGPLVAPDKHRVLGVEIVRRNAGDCREKLFADLIVDASGRGTQSPKWLEAMGYGRPCESIVKIDVGYATRIYKQIPGEHSAVDLLLSSGTPPHEKRGGLAVKIEGDRWMVGLAGAHGAHAPTDEAGYLTYAASLPTREIYDLISRAEPLTEIIPHKLPSSLRRHYEKMACFPEGYLVLGDAICSFNPIYGQGMTSAAMQAQALQQLLVRRKGALDGIARVFFKQAARIVNVPWQMAVGEDFRYVETTGPKPAGTDLLNAYSTLLHRATHSDAVVYQAFLNVMGLLAPPASLFAPNILLRVLRAGRSKPEAAPALHLQPAPGGD
jgi:2-polyprenyl-6-methoxyphenol hydroxylase-like FAD-dependent oxidoreductase